MLRAVRMGGDQGAPQHQGEERGAALDWRVGAARQLRSQMWIRGGYWGWVFPGTPHSAPETQQVLDPHPNSTEEMEA